MYECGCLYQNGSKEGIVKNPGMGKGGGVQRLVGQKVRAACGRERKGYWRGDAEEGGEGGTMEEEIEERWGGGVAF